MADLKKYSAANLTRLCLRPTRYKEGSGRADAGYARAYPIEPLSG
jgi:hypothetical protein